MTSSLGSSTVQGSLSLPLKYLANAIADSATFRSQTVSASRSDALGHIYAGGVPDTESPPLCVIRHISGEVTERLGTTNWSGSGPLRMFFIFTTNVAAADWNDAYLIFANNVGKIIDEIKVLSQSNPGSGPYLDIAGISLDALGQWDKDQEGEDYWEAEFTVNWRGM